ncbi:hypothetical protein CKO11_10890 [Rhodobacter sp. TJ_12]|uniref:hypothetical protein n=1 Tax=Rhodobacter sp. TJ_12 TaxID=2029399 RepID=UPI001CBB9DB4|nr:hypothetical protein [Rhodobacter sp. TJ_12]MBZ4022965.1 hypothetical protein [Rhodobacter sp. TJ_12]
MFLDISIACLAALILGAMFLPGLRNRARWRAMITPLASIIGSGFLVLGPILQTRFGMLAPLVMAALCGLAWTFGAAVRTNIAAESRPRTPAVVRLQAVAQATLAFAYVISVAYYLNLFGAFAVALTPWHGPLAGNLVTTAMLALIGVAGFAGGFKALERMEYASVALKLAIIGGLLLGLAAYFTRQAEAGALILAPASTGLWDGLRLGFGLIVTVQGFETARYLSKSYEAPTRIAAMRWAQILSTLIYLAYIGLLSYLFAPNPDALGETAIIDMMRVVSPILPAMLVAAALAAQLSAAVADTSGAGGLTGELSQGWLAPRQAYLVLVVAGIALTWSADLYAIIAYASRAFAAYYAAQSALAARHSTGARRAGYWGLCLLGLAIAGLGTPAEGS